MDTERKSREKFPIRTNAGRSRGVVAFSILELLVAMAVLALLTVLLATAFSNFAQVASSSSRRMETSQQARALFDRMAFDIGSAVKSGATGIAFWEDETISGESDSDNDVLVLLTDAKTSDPGGRMAVVGYEVGNFEDKSLDMDTRTVLRHVEPFAWEDDTTTMAITDAADAQPIAPGIIRFELAYLTANGTILGSPPPADADAETLRAFREDLTAVICAIATVDEDTLRRVTPEQLEDVALSLGNPDDGESPMSVWQEVDMSDLPPPVVQGLRFHERFFPVK